NLSVQPSGRTVLSAGPDGTVSLWSLGASREATTFGVRAGGGDQSATATAVLPDNCTAVLGLYTGQVTFWDLPTLRYFSIENRRESTKSGKGEQVIRGLFPVAGDKVFCASGHPYIDR